MLVDCWRQACCTAATCWGKEGEKIWFSKRVLIRRIICAKHIPTKRSARQFSSFTKRFSGSVDRSLFLVFNYFLFFLFFATGFCFPISSHESEMCVFFDIRLFLTKVSTRISRDQFVFKDVIWRSWGSVFVTGGNQGPIRCFKMRANLLSCFSGSCQLVITKLVWGKEGNTPL